MSFIKVNKLLVIFFVILFLGGFFAKNVVMAAEVDELPIGSSCSANSNCASGHCNKENWCVLKSSNCYSTIIGKEVPSSNYVCDGNLTKYSCSNGAFESSVTKGCTEEDSTTEPNSPSVSSASASTGHDVGAGSGPGVETSSGSNDSAVIPGYPDEVFSGSGVINLRSGTLTVGGIFSALLPYIYVIAGLILLFMLIMGGLGLMTAAGDPKKVEASQGRITMALVGFLIIFISYFIVQLVEVMLGVKIF